MMETVIGAIADPIFEQVLKLPKYVNNEVRKARSNANLKTDLNAACAEYEQRYRDRHGQIKIMPGLMKESVPLESVYTKIKFLDDKSLGYFQTEQDLEEAYRKSARRNFQLGTDKRLDGMEIANQEQYLMVLGGPGIGKSTFLRKLGMEALKSNSQLQWGRIPVFIELKNLKESDIDLVEIVVEEFQICGFPFAHDFVSQAIEKGKLLILFDGFDEVPKLNLNYVTECIENFVDQYHKNCFVASCRIAAYSSSFRRFTDVTIAEFDDEQIEQFIQRWFHSELDQKEETAKRYWELLSSSDHKATKELAQTPLLLTFLCLVYDREQTLPQNRSYLYGKALDILLNEWAAQKRLERDPIYEGFYPDLEKELLAQIAYDSFKQDQLFFSKVDITERIADFLADTLDVPMRLDGNAVLKAIEVQQGILVERATNTYSFSHLTIQEYLTAQYIVDKGLVNELVERYVTDDRWREVFLLIAGLSRGNIHRFLSKMENSATLIAAKSRKVDNLIAWSERITNTEHASLRSRATALYIASVRAITSTSYVAVRTRTSAGAIAIDIDIDRASVVAITSAIDSAIDSGRASAIDRAIASAIDSATAIAIAIANARTSAFAIDSAILILEMVIQSNLFSSTNLKDLPKQLSQLKQEIPERDAYWANNLIETWLNGFELTKDDLSLTNEDEHNLGDYLHITELLIRCKESAVRVSKQEWEAMEARLLTLQRP